MNETKLIKDIKQNGFFELYAEIHRLKSEYGDDTEEAIADLNEFFAKNYEFEKENVDVEFYDSVRMQMTELKLIDKS